MPRMSPPSRRPCQTVRARQAPGRRYASFLRVAGLAPLGLAAAAGAALPACARAASPVEEAALLAGKGQNEAASALLRDHVAKYPDAVRERRVIVRVLATSGDLGAVEREVQALAQRLPPDSPIPWLELGHAHELGHRYD